MNPSSSPRAFFHLVSWTLVVLLPLLLSSPAGAQHTLRKQNVLLDSVVWVPQALPIPGVVAGSATFFDYDNNCRLDILVAGVTDSGTFAGIFANDKANGFVNIEANLVPVASERGVSWGDFENDGDYDIALEGNRTPGTADPVSRVYRNLDGSFSEMQTSITNMNGGSVTWVDYNNDGRLDLFICGSPDLGTTFRSELYKNVHHQLVKDSISLPGVWGSSVGWADFDRDGDLDLLISGWDGSVQTRLFRNDQVKHGIQAFVEIPSPVQGLYPFEPVASSALAWFDYDNDGWPDLLLTGGGYDGPVAKIYHNDREGTFHDIGAQIAPVMVGAVAVGDYDNDGYVDIAINGAQDLYLGTNPTTKIYHNNGDSTFTDIGANLTGTWFGSVEWGDYDKDGRLDLLVTGGTVPRQYAGQDNTELKPATLLYRNTAIVDSNETPSVPSGTVAVLDGNTVTLSWDPASDAETSVSAISYNLRIGTTPGGIDVLSPLSNPETGFRRVPKIGNAGMRTSATVGDLPPGTYKWSVQSVDNQLTASQFSPEHTFTIVASSVDDAPEVPAVFALEQNYPNPFNPSTTIRYALPQRSHVTLVVFNMLGQQVAELTNSDIDAGYHEVQFNAVHIASGVYFYRLQAGNFVQVKKLLLLR